MKIRKVICICGIRLYEERITQFISSLKKEASKRGYFVMVLSANSDSLTDSDSIAGDLEFFDILNHFDICSMIILAESLKFDLFLSKLLNIGRSKHIPIFCTERNQDGCYNINFDYVTGFKKIVDHIVTHHKAKKINMIAGIKGNSFSEERLEAYKNVLRDNNIPIEMERIAYGDFWEVPTVNAMKQFFESDLPFPEAIVCANDAMAITCCSELNRYGFKVPEDVLVTGFDGITSSKYNFPPITTAIPDYDTLSENIVDELEHFEVTGIIDPKNMSVGFKLELNGSCSCNDNLNDADSGSIINKLIADINDCGWHTSAMNHMMTSTLDKTNVWDIASLLPKNLNLWNHIFKFAAVKSEMINGTDLNMKFDTLTTLLQTRLPNQYEPPGTMFKIDNVMPNFERILADNSGIDVLIVRSLNSGRHVYGYIANGFNEVSHRDLQRCDEFGMFLSDAIYSVLHSKMLNDLNTKLKQANAEITKLSERDSMTDIYNRRGFYEKLNEIVTRKKNKGKILYIFSLDMDNLKLINDNYGHSEGDFALISIANAMKALLSKHGIFARYGGDEFEGAAIFDKELDITLEDYQEIFAKALEAVPGVTEKPYKISASVGFDHCELNDDINVDEMIQKADRIMYDVKAKKKEKEQQEKKQ